VAIEGPSKVEIQPKDNKDGTVSISYTPTLPGEYKITVKYAGQPIEGAPFYAKISAPCMYLDCHAFHHNLWSINSVWRIK